jgi:hypothetical protein
MKKSNIVLKYRSPDGNVVKHTVNGSPSLPEALEAFENFLRGVGYVFDGSLDFVADAPTPIERAVGGLSEQLERDMFREDDEPHRGQPQPGRFDEEE